MLKKFKSMILGLIALMIVLPAYASSNSYNFNTLTTNGKTLNDSLDTVDSYAIRGYNTLKVIGVFLGLLFIVVGVMRLKKANESNGQIGMGQGIFLVVLGGAMASVSTILLIMAATVQS